jgi:hypothetical protein
MVLSRVSRRQYIAVSMAQEKGNVGGALNIDPQVHASVRTSESQGS